MTDTICQNPTHLSGASCEGFDGEPLETVESFCMTFNIEIISAANGEPIALNMGRIHIAVR